MEEPRIILRSWTTSSPLGHIVVVTSGVTVCALEFIDEWPHAILRFTRRWRDAELVTGPRNSDVANKIERYFNGDICAVADLPVECRGTGFQRIVWQELQRVPPGHTVTYAELARRVNCPAGFRAVGNASRLNPAAIVVPCHRAVGADGSLRGYAGGLDRKRWLLAHEARHTARSTG